MQRPGRYAAVSPAHGSVLAPLIPVIVAHSRPLHAAGCNLRCWREISGKCLVHSCARVLSVCFLASRKCTATFITLLAAFCRTPLQVLPLTLYAAQLALNWTWLPALLQRQGLDAALGNASALVGMAAAATVSMAKASAQPAVVPLMAPYLLWTVYATALTHNIWLQNPEEVHIMSA